MLCLQEGQLCLNRVFSQQMPALRVCGFELHCQAQNGSERLALGGPPDEGKHLIVGLAFVKPVNPRFLELGLRLLFSTDLQLLLLLLRLVGKLRLPAVGCWWGFFEEQVFNELFVMHVAIAIGVGLVDGIPVLNEGHVT